MNDNNEKEARKKKKKIVGIFSYGRRKQKRRETECERGKVTERRKVPRLGLERKSTTGKKSKERLSFPII